MTTLADIRATIAEARAKHGERSVRNLPEFDSLRFTEAVLNEQVMLDRLESTGSCARWACDNGHATQAAVLIEEVAEALSEADPVKRRKELERVMGVVAEMLGVEL